MNEETRIAGMLVLLVCMIVIVSAPWRWFSAIALAICGTLIILVQYLASSGEDHAEAPPNRKRRY